MRVPIRKTINGTEYWDTEFKKSILVPTGVEPDFEVTENPKSLLTSSTVDDQPDGPITSFADMTIKELRVYAKENEITIPAEIKNKEDIVIFLNDGTLSDGVEVEADTE